MIVIVALDRQSLADMALPVKNEAPISDHDPTFEGVKPNKKRPELILASWFLIEDEGPHRYLYRMA